MKKLEMVKAILKIAVSIGVGTIVGNAIKTTTPDDIKQLSKIAVSLGSLALTGIASDMAIKYVDKEVDDMVKAAKDAKEEVYGLGGVEKPAGSDSPCDGGIHDVA